MEKKELYKKLLEKHGADMQTDQCIEEFSELIKAFIKFRKCKEADIDLCRHAIIDELADCEIMIEQMKLIYDKYNEFENYKYKKLNRQISRIESEIKS